jgi:hypothetical protein
MFPDEDVSRETSTETVELTDRELLLTILAKMESVEAIAHGVSEQVAPLLKSPMLGMFTKMIK